MNSTLSTRQLRLVVLLGLVVLCAGAFMVVTRHKSTSPTTASSTPSVTTPAHTKTTPSSPSKAHTRAATPSVTRVAIQHGMPIPVARALAKNRVVVVSLFAPHSDVDQVATSEAKAGAQLANAGFVAIDAYSQRPGTAILRKLGVVNTPVVLVVRRPYVIASEFHGFADSGVVEQAVADAR
jgi:hypothetical protein